MAHKALLEASVARADAPLHPRAADAPSARAGRQLLFFRHSARVARVSCSQPLPACPWSRTQRFLSTGGSHAPADRARAAAQMSAGGYFSSDRAVKYGYGLPRLALLTLAAFTLAPRLSPRVPGGAAEAALGLRAYLASRRWVAHAYLGSVGAAVNVCVQPFAVNLALLLIGAALCIADVRHDYAILIYLAKTFGGDFLAGKLDTREWRLVLLFVFGLFGPALYWLEREPQSAYAPYSRIFPALFVIQAICELGDNYAEQYVFFRHRYAFEAASAALLFAIGPSPAELAVVQHDLVVCLFYRAANFAIILERSGALWDAARRCAFALFGLVRGTPLVAVRDAALAVAVLRASDEKGGALERYVASPAWRPLISLESVDGPLYKAMLADLHAVLAVLPPPSALQAICQARCDALRASGALIDADAVARLSLASVVEYLFGVAWADDLEVLVRASWEWRKEIAVRGKADAAAKDAAVAAVLRLVRATPRLWGLFGDKWHKPRYYSLLMQPFLLSPCINVGDVAVTLAAQPALGLDDAIRAAHPFPIFERFVRSDIADPSDPCRVAIKGGTQVIMFTSDLANGGAWPVFGAGPRACAGTSLALALMRPIHATLRSLDTFRPAAGHRFSGRNNDGSLSVSEALYFLRAVAPVVLFARGGQAEDAYAAQ